MTAEPVYSTYDAKARFSEVIRHVREGRTVIVTYRGDPVAEIRPLDRSGGTSARMEWLRGRGVLVDAEQADRRLMPIATRPGALERFLSDRNG